MKGSEFINWVNLYNAAPLDNSCSPLNDSVLMAKSCNAVICSTLTRSIESAEKLGVGEEIETSSDFVEAGLPTFNVLNLKFSESFWLFLFRVSWFFGYAPNSESYSQAKVRARDCAHQLIKTAQEKGSVIFIGHGILNRLISKELQRCDWQGPTKTKNKYWQFSIYKNEVERD